MALPNPLKTNLSAITTAATTVASLANLVMVSPQATKGYQPIPKPNSQGKLPPFPPTLLFHYEGEQIATIESDITDHFVEDNTTIVDQIGLKPEIFKTSGYIGDLSDVLRPELQPLQEAANILVTIDGFFPALSVTALTAYTQALLLYENAESIRRSAVSAYSSISPDNNSTGEISDSGAFVLQTNTLIQTPQQKMFQQLYGYWYARTLFNIQTPWCILSDMAILSLRAIQDESTRTITDFEIIFKKIRFADTLITPGPITSGRLATQSALPVNNGITGNQSVSSTPSLGTEVTGSLR